MSPLHTYLAPEQLLAVRGVACAIKLVQVPSAMRMVLIDNQDTVCA